MDYNALKVILKMATPEDKMAPKLFAARFCDELERVNSFFDISIKQQRQIIMKQNVESSASRFLTRSRSSITGSDAMPLDAREALEGARCVLAELKTYSWINARGFLKMLRKMRKKWRNCDGHALLLAKDDDEASTLLHHERFLSHAAERLSVQALDIIKSMHEVAMEMRLIAVGPDHTLACEISGRLGVPLVNLVDDKFSDGEIALQINETVRNTQVFILSTFGTANVNDELVRLLLLISTLKRSAAARVVAVMPYLPYSRQAGSRTSTVENANPASDVVRLLESMGVDHVVCLDLHSDSIRGVSAPSIAIDSFQASAIAMHYFTKKTGAEDLVLVSPDANGVVRTNRFVEGMNQLGCGRIGFAIVPATIKDERGESSSRQLIGSVKGCNCVIIDDLIDSAKTICSAANALKAAGASKIWGFVTHAILSSDDALERLERSALDELLVTNTIPHPSALKSCRKVKQISIAKLLSVAILGVHHNSLPPINISDSQWDINPN